MMRKLIFVIWVFLICQSLSAQHFIPFAPEHEEKDSVDVEMPAMRLLERLDVNQDLRLEKLLKWHVENNERKEGIDGFRVEIFFSSALNARELSQEKKKDFLSKYPDYNVHIKFISPNFRVRVGDFRTKNEALKLYKKIEEDFPGAFIVPDIIDLPLLKTENYERSD